MDERTVVVVVTGEGQTRGGGDRKSDVKMPPSAPRASRRAIGDLQALAECAFSFTAVVATAPEDVVLQGWTFRLVCVRLIK